MTEEKFRKPKRQKVTLDLPSEEEKQITSSLLSRLLGPQAALESKADAKPASTPVISAPVTNAPETITPVIVSPAIDFTNAGAIITTRETTTPVINTPEGNTPVTASSLSLEKDQVKIETRLVAQEISTPEKQFPRKSIPENKYPGEAITPVITTPENKYPKNIEKGLRSSRDPGYYTPNWIDDEIMPTLHLSEQVLLRRLFRLSYGFNKQITDPISIPKLAEKCNLSDKGVKLAIKALEERGLIIAHRDFSGNPLGGNRYEVFTQVMSIPETKSPGEKLPGEISASIKDHDHEDLKNHDHDQTAHERETRMIYQTITGNNWKKADQVAYEKIKHIPVEIIEQGIRITLTRASTRPGSLAYFVKEILVIANPAPAQRGVNKRALSEIVARVRELNVGRSLTIGELAEEVKRACARQGVLFDSDLFQEIIG
jgi:hypothetical protein